MMVLVLLAELKGFAPVKEKVPVYRGGRNVGHRDGTGGIKVQSAIIAVRGAGGAIVIAQGVGTDSFWHCQGNSRCTGCRSGSSN